MWVMGRLPRWAFVSILIAVVGLTALVVMDATRTDPWCRDMAISLGVDSDELARQAEQLGDDPLAQGALESAASGNQTAADLLRQC